MDIEKLMNDSNFCEELGDVILSIIAGYDASPRSVGTYALKAYKDNDANDMLTAICGWTMDTLIKAAQEQIEDYEQKIL